VAVLKGSSPNVTTLLSGLLDESWTLSDADLADVFVRPPRSGVRFATNIVVLHDAGSELDDGLRNPVVLASSEKSSGVISGHEVVVSAERGVTVTQEIVVVSRPGESVTFTSSAAGHDVGTAASAMRDLVQRLSEWDTNDN